MISVNYFNAPAGSGKTYAFVQDIANRLDLGDRVLLAVPTVHLANETEAELNNNQCLVSSINNRTNPGSVVEDIMKHVLTPGQEPHVLLITHQALERLSTDSWRKHWHLYVDEIPSVHRPFEKNLSKTHSYVTPYLTCDQPDDSGYAKLRVTDKDRIEELAHNKSGDEILSPFEDFCHSLSSPHWDTFVPKDVYDKLASGADTRYPLTAYSLLRPSIIDGFASVHMAGANFTRSLLYAYWKKNGVHFIQRSTDSLRYNTHPNGTGLEIFYFIEGDWSKEKAEKNGVLKILEREVAKHFTDQDFLYSENKGSPLFHNLKNAQLLDYAPQGLNCFQTYNNFTHIAARNPTPGFCKFLQKKIGLSEEDIRNSFHREIAYQMALRSSARDPENHNKKQFVFPDKGTASYIHDLFPGSKLTKIDSELDELFKTKKKVGRPKIYSSPSERVIACNDRKKQRLLLQEPKDFLPQKELFERMINESPINESTYRESFVNGFSCSVFKSIKSLKPLRVRLQFDFEGFAFELQKCHENTRLEAKTKNVLVSPAFFSPFGEDKLRGLNNAIFMKGLWFDVEKGDIYPDEFAEILDHFEMVIYSSFNSRLGAPRYRAYIPTSEILNAVQYDAIMRGLVARFEAQGYGVSEGSKRHGIDPRKLHGVSLFYLPGQPANPPDDYFPYFKIFTGEGRRPFDVGGWRSSLKSKEDALEPQLVSVPDVKPAVAQKEVFRVANEHIEFDDRSGRVEAAIDEWRTVACAPNMDNHNFYLLGLTLGCTGVPAAEIEEILKLEARHAHTPHDRLSQIRSIIASLGNYGYLDDSSLGVSDIGYINRRVAPIMEGAI